VTDLFEERTMSVYDVRTGPVPGFKNAKYITKGRLHTNPAVVARIEKIQYVLKEINPANSDVAPVAIYYEDYEKLIGKMDSRKINSKWIARTLKKISRIRAKLAIRVIFYLSDYKTRDLDNMLATVLDCLKKAKIIKDDSVSHIGSVTATYRIVGKGQEGFRATIIK
jgi:Holliday junction resolvase RusA-like endonuclease